MSEEERRNLEQQLWNIANTLRGKMNADEFRDYILGFIFYKYLSEKVTMYADRQLEVENIRFADLKKHHPHYDEFIEELKRRSVDELGYFLLPEELFHNIALKGGNLLNDGNSGNFILEDLGKALSSIENSTLGTASHDDFNHLFEDLDLNSTKLGRSVDDRNRLVAQILMHLDNIRFDLDAGRSDILGDAYEYLIAQFASSAGKKAGEFYTPQAVSTLLARLVTVEKKMLRNVYDPTCGSGSLLLRVKREAQKIDKIYGQELNRTTYNLARMNMILHDVHYDSFEIRQEDTLESPQHLDIQFDAIVANPPFSFKWSARPLFMSDDRFSRFGRLAPASKADMAFIQHMLYHLAEDGTMACLAPHGVLFRGAAEGHIRQFIIRELNYLDAVIGLPSNIFYATGIPTCILVFKRCRKNPDDILFIDASNDFEKVRTQNHLLPEHIDKIMDAYVRRENQDRYCRVVPISEIVENDYNLNIPRYVDTFEGVDEIDISTVAGKLRSFNLEIQGVESQIAEFCQELGIEMPF